MLQKQKYEFVCFVNPPSLDDVFSIAEGGEVMPQKSTYFFPKVYSGLFLGPPYLGKLCNVG